MLPTTLMCLARSWLQRRVTPPVQRYRSTMPTTPARSNDDCEHRPSHRMTGWLWGVVVVEAPLVLMMVVAPRRVEWVCGMVKYGLGYVDDDNDGGDNGCGGLPAVVATMVK
ncbi:Hypothetical predicted protein [Olea europaea subsp. europaea]|uniref:Uncharacterized protein n=1 Tax=Olea europaea subsp. europaea TaxID=158383 RepID=A0A8S0VGL7_OLEEU|nr:Hypothetical predicted protein [Olea europaea subsp. europaea]